jgi:EthD domain
MVRVVVLYEEELDAERYERHAELCRAVPGVTFRHGKVFGAPFGDPAFVYYAEMEFADMDAFRAATKTPEFAATGTDSKEMGYRSTVQFVELA